MEKGERPNVEIPAGEGRPLWSRVGLVAGVCFAIGVVWPKLLGLEIGPDAPNAEEEQAPPATPDPEPEAPKAAPKKADDDGATSNRQQIVVEPGVVTKCFDNDGDAVESCGVLKFDRVAKPKLQELSKCPSALGLSGTISIAFDVDFKKQSVTVGKGDETNLPGSTVRGVLKCAAQEFENLNLDKVPNQHARYKILYGATFYPPGTDPPPEAEAAADGEPTAAEPKAKDTEGMASVKWETALVREKPKDGEVMARLAFGTRVSLVEKQGNWYRIDSGTATGWVHQKALKLESEE